MVNSGIYRDRIRIEQFTVAEDEAGGAARSWRQIAEVNCQLMEMAPGMELFGAGTEVAEGTVRVRMRETPDFNLDPAMRFVDVDRGTIYEITQILPTRLREELTVLVRHGGVKR